MPFIQVKQLLAPSRKANPAPSGLRSQHEYRMSNSGRSASKGLCTITHISFPLYFKSVKTFCKLGICLFSFIYERYKITDSHIAGTNVLFSVLINSMGVLQV